MTKVRASAKNLPSKFVPQTLMLRTPSVHSEHKVFAFGEINIDAANHLLKTINVNKANIR